MILIVASVPDVVAVTDVLAGRDWPYRVATAINGSPPDVIVCTADGASPDTPCRLRVADPHVPVVALASAEWLAAGDWRARGYDDAVDRARLRDDLPATVAEWRHAERLAILDRLVATFGRVPVAEMLRGLRQSLERVLTERDDATLAADAHRIAGLAGTLGFARVGRLWLRAAEGERPVTPATHRATLHALATIDRAAP